MSLISKIAGHESKKSKKSKKRGQTENRGQEFGGLTFGGNASKIQSIQVGQDQTLTNDNRVHYHVPRSLSKKKKNRVSGFYRYYFTNASEKQRAVRRPILRKRLEEYICIKAPYNVQQMQDAMINLIVQKDMDFVSEHIMNWFKLQIKQQKANQITKKEMTAKTNPNAAATKTKWKSRKRNFAVLEPDTGIENTAQTTNQHKKRKLTTNPEQQINNIPTVETENQTNQAKRPLMISARQDRRIKDTLGKLHTAVESMEVGIRMCNEAIDALNPYREEALTDKEESEDIFSDAEERSSQHQALSMFLNSTGGMREAFDCLPRIYK